VSGIAGLIRPTITVVTLQKAAHQSNLSKCEVRSMEFFTALYIEYTLRGIDVETYLILPDYEACQIAIRDNEDMYKYFRADSDVDMYCIRTGKLSRSIKPKLRPSVQSVAHQ